MLYQKNTRQLLVVIIFIEKLYHRFFSGKISDSEPHKGNPRCMWNPQLIACEHVFELNFWLAISQAKSSINNEAKTAIMQIRVILNLASDFEPTFECKWQYTYNYIFVNKDLRNHVQQICLRLKRWLWFNRIILHWDNI